MTTGEFTGSTFLSVSVMVEEIRVYPIVCMGDTWSANLIATNPLKKMYSFVAIIRRFTTQSRRSHHLTSDYFCKLSNKISSGDCAPRELQLWARQVKTGSLFPRSNVSFPDFHHLSCQNVVLNQMTRLEQGPLPRAQWVLTGDSNFFRSQCVWTTTVCSIFSLNFWCSVSA